MKWLKVGLTFRDRACGNEEVKQRLLGYSSMSASISLKNGPLAWNEVGRYVETI